MYRFRNVILKTQKDQPHKIGGRVGSQKVKTQKNIASFRSVTVMVHNCRAHVPRHDAAKINNHARRSLNFGAQK
jgi:hypothetical protein